MPSSRFSSVAFAEMFMKIPVVKGQVMSVLCLVDKRARISVVVISFPLGTVAIIASTSLGVEMTIEALGGPHLFRVSGNSVILIVLSSRIFSIADLAIACTSKLIYISLPKEKLSWPEC